MVSVGIGSLSALFGLGDPPFVFDATELRRPCRFGRSADFGRFRDGENEVSHFGETVVEVPRLIACFLRADQELTIGCQPVGDEGE